MCLICIRPPDGNLTEAQRKASLSHNNDGFGLMWADGDEIVIRRTLIKEFPHQNQIWEGAPKDRTVIAHWRAATHGSTSLDNCQPVAIHKEGNKVKLALAHNGVMSSFGTRAWEGDSDTVGFAKWLVSEKDVQTLDDIQRNGKLQKFIKHLAKSNRLVFFDHTGKIVIYGHGHWLETEKVWVSNEYSLKPVASYAGWSSSRSNTVPNSSVALPAQLTAALRDTKYKLTKDDVAPLSWRQIETLTYHHRYAVADLLYDLSIEWWRAQGGKMRGERIEAEPEVLALPPPESERAS